MSGHFGVGFYMFIHEKGENSQPGRAVKNHRVEICPTPTSTVQESTDFFFGGGKGREGYRFGVFPLLNGDKCHTNILGLKGIYVHTRNFTPPKTLEKRWLEDHFLLRWSLLSPFSATCRIRLPLRYPLLELQLKNTRQIEDIFPAKCVPQTTCSKQFCPPLVKIRKKKLLHGWKHQLHWKIYSTILD